MSVRRCVFGRGCRRCWRSRWPPRYGCGIKLNPAWNMETKMSRRNFSLALARGVIATFVMLAAVPASAQDYPTRPIRILVPYAPGGIADIAARIVGAKLTEAWGQQVAVENRPGGNGFIAMELTARSVPDGYTLVMCTVGDVAINPGLFQDMPYNVARDLVTSDADSDAAVVLAAQGGRRYVTVKDVSAVAK